MEFRILGRVEAVHAAAPLALGGPRHRRLLAILLLRAGTVVPTDTLIHALWGDTPPSSATAMVHVRVSELRAALRVAASGLITHGGGYRLAIDADDLDARRFERLAAAGAAALAAGDPAGARTDLAAGLALWRGPALDEFADEQFACAEAARLEELRRSALENRIAADLELGRHAEVVAELETLVAEHPLRERFWEQLMLALYRAGRQADALRAYRRIGGLMAEDLGVDPGGDLRRLQAAVLRQDPALDPPAAARRGNLPAPLTSFVGRRREVPDIRALLREHRLVTLTGVGGVGKSRLAVEVARAGLADLPGGAWLVELAALGEPGLVASAVAASLRVREHPRRPFVDVLADHIGDRRLLLVLDNCEHRVAEVAGVADRLLRSCPNLRILATSRERLGLTGEVVRPLSGLGVPGPAAAKADAVGRADAVRLFVDRAAAADPDFRLTDSTAVTVTAICRRLDGLPLALELAAAGAYVWGVAEVAARLDDPYRLLTHGSRTAPARQRTLRAVVDWSYGLLDPDQRRLFDRLAVFTGGFTTEAVEAVTGADAGLLAALVDKSLVTVAHPGTGQPRYAMLETVRAYAAERLEASGAAATARDRHTAYVLAMVRTARRGLRGADEPAWLRRLEAELGNIRAALRWSVERGDAATAVRLAGSLYPLWDRHGHYREGRRWLTDALDLPGPVPPLVRARAFDTLAGLAVLQGDLDAGGEAAERAAALSRAAEDRAGTASALTTRGLVAIYADDLPMAVRLLDEAASAAREAGDPWSGARALLYLAIVALARRDDDRAALLLAESEPLLRSIGDREGLPAALMLRSEVARRAGDHVAAAAALRGALDGFRHLDHSWALSIGLIVAAEHTGAAGHHERAMSLLGASQALRDTVGAAVMPFLTSMADGVRARAGAALGTTAADRAWHAGRRMSVARALAEATTDPERAGHG